MVRGKEIEARPKIEGLGTAVILGSQTVTNDDLERFFLDTAENSGFSGLTADEIFERTGIKRRYHMAEGENVVDFAVYSAQSALAERGWTGEMIDRIIVCASFGRQVDISAYVKDKLNAKNASAKDLYAACASPVMTLKYLDRQISSAENILILSADQYSDKLAQTGFHSRHLRLFGDGTAAIVGTIGKSQDCDIQILGTDTLYYPSDAIRMPIEENLFPENSINYPVPNSAQFFEMDGESVLQALRSDKIRGSIRYFYKHFNPNNRLPSVSISHQSSRPVIDLKRRQLVEMGIESEITSFTLGKYGNIGAASTFGELDAVINRRDLKESLVFLKAYGGGIYHSMAAVRIKSPR